MYIELGLATLLAVLIYEKPLFLMRFISSTLGKIIMILMVGILAKQVSLNSGILAAIIMIILMEHFKEGMTSNEDIELKKGKEVPFSVGIGCDKPGCAKDSDCAACNKVFHEKTDENGEPLRCECSSTCESGHCKCSCKDPKSGSGKEKKSHGSGTIEEYQNMKISLNTSPFPVTGTDQVTIDRVLKINAIQAKNAAAMQANGCTNDGIVTI